MLSFLHRFFLPAALILCAVSDSAAQQPVGVLYASDASVKGSVMLAGSGTSVLSGSSIEAGRQPAMLKLDRGGTVVVCEGTKLSVGSSATGREMMYSLNSGNLELNYPLGTEADTLLTPDFRLLLPGPGTVHVAVRVTPQGDTCVQSLPWNASAIVVSESMGDATYQVKPDEAVLFKGGHLSEASRSRQNCGCPTAAPVEVAKAAAPPPPVPVQSTAAEPASTAAAPPVANDASQPVTTAPPPEQHLAVDAPFIFHGDDPVPDLRQNVVMLKLDKANLVPFEPTVIGPPQTKSEKKQPAQVARKESHHLFGKLGAFFASIFH